MTQEQNKDFSSLTIIAGHCGFIPHKDRSGKIVEGVYTFGHLHAPVDLSDCPLDEKSILKSAVEQLSKQADESFHNAIERDFLD